jgi:hypothetical protein
MKMHAIVTAVAAGLCIPATFALGIFLSDKALNNNGKLDYAGEISGRDAEIDKELDHGKEKSKSIQIAPDLSISIPTGSQIFSGKMSREAYRDQVFRAPVSLYEMERSILSDLTENHDEEFTVSVSRAPNIGRLEFKSRKTSGVVEIRGDHEGGCIVRIDVSQI